MKKIYKVLIVGSAILPLLAAAATTDVQGLIETAQNLINRLIPFFVAIAALVFIWGVVEFVASAGDEEKRSKGRQHMLWGIVGLAVIVGLWGLVKILVQTFSLQQGGTIDLPKLPFQ